VDEVKLLLHDLNIGLSMFLVPELWSKIGIRPWLKL